MYVEDLLALNFMMNTSLLYLTARLTGKQPAGIRLLAGGLLAAVYSLVIFWPGAVFVYTWAGKIAVSVLIIVFTFRPRRSVELLRLCGAFFLASFFLAGTIFALYFFGSTPAVVRGGVFYIAPPRPGMLFGGVLVAFFLIAGVWHFSERQRKGRDLRFGLLLRNDGKEVNVRAFVDTGNQLRDPVSGRPLCVVSYRAVRELMPDVLQKAFDHDEDPVRALANLTEKNAGRYGVVPFRSLENAGMLVTFRPEAVIITGQCGSVERHDLVFAITAKALSLDDDAEVLLNPAIMESMGGVVI
ncbi:MAG: sigma-E processing peptidase SpoIIGA [Bacillota bacterium]|nr:sigma-E processing peptidase SpoIIGA [Bacillota bacterium]MDW7684010.1 sigma-E processing peptidase SpoIIGA [Bacillota bacterium]